MKKYIQRKGYVEQVWQVQYEENGFKYKIFVRGTEPEMQAYMESEMRFVGGYSACTDTELAAVKTLKLPIYIAPELNS